MARRSDRDASKALGAISRRNGGSSSEKTGNDNRKRSGLAKRISQGKAQITDLWAPPRMDIYNDYIEMGDRACCELTISNWPSSLSFGWLQALLATPELSDIRKDVNMHIFPVRKDLARLFLESKSGQAESAARAEIERGKVKEANQDLYRRQMSNAGQMLSILDSRNENFFQVSVIITIWGEQNIAEGKTAQQDCVEKVKRVTSAINQSSTNKFALLPLDGQQREGLKSALPIGYGGLHAFQNFSTSALAKSYPFTQGTLQNPNGIFYGLDGNGLPLFIDGFDNKTMYDSFNLLCIGNKGSGKAIESSTPVHKVIRTENGQIKTTVPVPIGWIHPGDTIIGGDGNPCTVMSVHPQGVLHDNYLVRLADGREIHANANHLWKVQSDAGEEVLRTDELYARSSGFLVPVMPGIPYSEKELPQDPGSVGREIAEGHAAGIPSECLCASMEQRMELLLGIIRSCGSERDGLTVLEAHAGIAADCMELVRSLGYSAVIEDGADGGKLITIRGMNIDGSGKPGGWIGIESIKPSYKPADMTCITVDSPDHTFVCGDYVVTHNSVTAKTLLGRYGVQGTQIFILDPGVDEHGEYAGLMLSLDGDTMDFGSRDGVYYNPFLPVIPLKLPQDPVEIDNITKEVYNETLDRVVTLMFIMNERYEALNSSNNRPEGFRDVVRDTTEIFYELNGFGNSDPYNTDNNVPLNVMDWAKHISSGSDTLVNIDSYYRFVCDLINVVENIPNPDVARSVHAQMFDTTSGRINAMGPRDMVRWLYLTMIFHPTKRLWGDRELAVLQRMQSMLRSYVISGKEMPSTREQLLFHGNTNKPADLSKPALCFRFASLMANEKERADDPKSLMPMAIYLSFSLIYGRISSGDDYGFMHKIICIDEGWKFLTNPAASQYVQSVCREGRKQGAGLWLISQSYEDFQTDTTKIYWNLAETKIIMKVPPQEARKITAALQLPTSFARSLAEAETGQAVISIDGKVKACMTFNPCPTKLELAIAAGSAGARPITVQDMENPSFI